MFFLLISCFEVAIKVTWTRTAEQVLRYDDVKDKPNLYGTKENRTQDLEITVRLTKQVTSAAC